MALPLFIRFWPYLTGSRGPGRIARFWSHVDRGGPDECWDWTAGLSSKGYGRFKIASYTMIHANRVAWAIQHECDPGQLIVRHSCDRPSCCNPAHLLIGTVADNNQDKLARGRWRGGRQDGEHNGAAKLTEIEVSAIVDALNAGQSNKQIARRYPVGHATISRIRVGMSWRGQARAMGWEARPLFVRRSCSPPPIDGTAGEGR